MTFAGTTCIIILPQKDEEQTAIKSDTLTSHWNSVRIKLKLKMYVYVGVRGSGEMVKGTNFTHKQILGIGEPTEGVPRCDGR